MSERILFRRDFKKMKKNNTARIFGRVSVIICTLALIAALCVGVSAHSFRDVNEYDEAIDLLSSIEVIKGYSNTSFGPNDNVTRWQMALLISKLRTGRVETSVWEATGSSTEFPDVKPASHYPAAINYAHNNGIIIGRVNATTGAQEFAPDENITVQDGITMCVRALGYPKNQYDSGYPNSYISKGKELGLFEGLYNLSYTAKLTRGQTAQMLYNALFAPEYNGSTLADDAFGFIDSNIVLAATENLRFDTNVKYASSGKYTFAIINDYGRLGDSFELDASMFDFDNANEALGTMYSIRATGDYETILALDLVSKVLPDSKTASLSISGSSNITMGGISYKPVSQRSYALENGKTPSNKEILVYALNDDILATNGYTSGKLLSVSNMQGTTGYYTMRAFDDNGDGYADRAFYKAYSFGQYKADSSGRLSIAGNNTASQIKIVDKAGKTTTVTDGSYVLFAYDSQTKTLEIYKTLTEFKDATIGSAYNSTNSTLTVNSVQYQVGSNDVRGAAISTVAKDVTTLTATTSRKLSGYYDTDKKIIFVCTLQGEEVSLSGNYYYGDAAMILNVEYIQGYESSYNTGYQQGYTPTVNFYPAVKLSIKSFINSESNTFIVNAVDGTTVTQSNMYQLLQRGNVVKVAQSSTRTVSNGSQYVTYPVVNLTTVNNKASATTNNTSTVLYVSTDSSSVTKLFFLNTAAGMPESFSYIVDENTKIYVYDGYNPPVEYPYSEFSTWTLNTDTDGETTGGKTITSSLYNYYHAVYVNTANTYYAGYTTNIKATSIILKPFDYSSYASTSTSYNGIVYIPATSINQSGYSGVIGSTYAYAYAGFNLSTGTTVNVQLSSAKGKLTTAGYYKVLNNYITDITPVTSSIANESLTFTMSPTISSFRMVEEGKYQVTVGNMIYIIPKANIKIYQKTSSNYYGYTTETMTEITETSTNGSMTFDTALQFVSYSASTVKAIYMGSTQNLYSSYYYQGPFYIII